MAYMRGEHYVWSDGENLHIQNAVLPTAVAEELAAMLWHQMSEDEQQSACWRAVAHHGGNFGCVELCEVMGVRSAYDLVDEALRARGIDVDARG